MCACLKTRIYFSTHFPDIKFYILIFIFLFNLIQFLIIKFNHELFLCNFKSEISRCRKLSGRSNCFRLHFSWTIIYNFISD